MRADVISHRFVEFVPAELLPATLYVSMQYATAVHSCCCGCGNRVVTPLSPAGWSLTFDGEAVSLAPSVGNGSFPCRSHYWIDRDRVEWLPTMSDYDSDRARHRDRAAQVALEESVEIGDRPSSNGPRGLVRRALRWIERLVFRK